VTRHISLLGSTGSIGTNTLKIVRGNQDRFKISSLVCGNNIDLLRSQIREFHPRVVGVSLREDCRKLKKEFSGIRFYHGKEGLMEAVMCDEADTVVSATTGTHSIQATLEAIKVGKRICLANKETLVAAGDLVNEYLDQSDSLMIPIDSEQSAIFQCICENDRSFLKKVILTASGGPFHKTEKEDFVNISAEDALKHPVWTMGKKITIDSSTLMNKALEIIEAFYLFHLRPEQIDLLIHPQSIVHSMVEFVDHSVLAQLGNPDMKIPIQYSLSYPGRFAGSAVPLDLASISCLEFISPDIEKFPSIGMAYRVIRERKNSGLIFNAANEVAVEKFLKGALSFKGIFRVVESMLDLCGRAPVNSSDDLSPMIESVKKRTEEFIRKKDPVME